MIEQGSFCAYLTDFLTDMGTKTEEDAIAMIKDQGKTNDRIAREIYNNIARDGTVLERAEEDGFSSFRPIIIEVLSNIYSQRIMFTIEVKDPVEVNLIRDILKEQGKLSVSGISKQLSHLGYLHNLRTLRGHIYKLVMNGTLKWLPDCGRTQYRFKINDNPNGPIVPFPSGSPESITEHIKKHLPRTREKAMTSKEVYATGSWDRFSSVTSRLSQLYLDGAIKRKGRRPYQYWVEPTEGETVSMQTHTLSEFLSDESGPPESSVDAPKQATPYGKGQDILARLHTVETDITNMQERYEQVGLALKKRGL